MSTDTLPNTLAALAEAATGLLRHLGDALPDDDRQTLTEAMASGCNLEVRIAAPGGAVSIWVERDGDALELARLAVETIRPS